MRETDGLVVMSVGLNDLAKPGIGGDGEVDFNAAEDGWVQAGATGTLPRALTAPKGDSGGFYRVIVR